MMKKIILILILSQYCFSALYGSMKFGDGVYGFANAGFQPYNTSNTVCQRMHVAPSMFSVGVSHFMYALPISSLTAAMTKTMRSTDSMDLAVYDTLGNQLNDTIYKGWIYFDDSGSAAYKNTFQIECGNGSRSPYHGTHIFTDCGIFVFEPCNDTGPTTVNDLAGADAGTPSHKATAHGSTFGQSGINGNCIYLPNGVADTVGDITCLLGVGTFTIRALAKISSGQSGLAIYFNKYQVSTNERIRLLPNFTSNAWSNVDITNITSGTASISSPNPAFSSFEGNWTPIAMIYNGSNATDTGKCNIWIGDKRQTLTVTTTFPILNAVVNSCYLTFSYSSPYSCVMSIQNVMIFTRAYSKSEDSAYNLEQMNPATFDTMQTWAITSQIAFAKGLAIPVLNTYTAACSLSVLVDNGCRVSLQDSTASTGWTTKSTLASQGAGAIDSFHNIVGGLGKHWIRYQVTQANGYVSNSPIIDSVTTAAAPTHHHGGMGIGIHLGL